MMIQMGIIFAQYKKPEREKNTTTPARAPEVGRRVPWKENSGRKAQSKKFNIYYHSRHCPRTFTTQGLGSADKFVIVARPPLSPTLHTDKASVLSITIMCPHRPEGISSPR
jgi:hypothetical protein